MGIIRLYRTISILVTVVLVAVCFYLANQSEVWNRYFGKLRLNEGYKYEVIATNLKRVDNIAKTSNGELYATLERKYPKGKLVQIGDEGKITIILDQLDRPDGLEAKNGKLYFTEETENGRIIEYNLRTSTQRTITKLDNAEGLAILSKEELLITEDKAKGRLLKVTLSGVVSLILDDLFHPEGIAIDKHGVIYIAETGSGTIYAYKSGQLDSIIGGLSKPDQLAVDKESALWITEDATPGRLLRYFNNKLETIVDGLWAPQGIIVNEDSILVAEQKRDRIIRVSKLNK